MFVRACEYVRTSVYVCACVYARVSVTIILNLIYPSSVTQYALFSLVLSSYKGDVNLIGQVDYVLTVASPDIE